jgi:hypothetical protein
VRLLISLVACALSVLAGPVDFGWAELNAAMAARRLRWKNQAELSVEAPETYRIEPYSYGGAHITGGDLRGLMYGLLEAAEQIRATGRLAKVHGVPATPLRGVYIALNPRLEGESEDFWRAYFQMLARNRFNRVHIGFTNFAPPYRLEKLLSQLAADYGIDFTLGIGSGIGADQLVELLAACPMIRSVAVEPGSGSRDAVFMALRTAGRRVTLDPDAPQAAADTGVAVLRPVVPWPPAFEIAPPFDAAAEDHPVFYWIWGRLGYDPKTKSPKGGNPEDYRAAGDTALLLSAAKMAQQPLAGGSDFVASIGEATLNRLNHAASAKLAPIDVLDRLEAAAVRLDHAAIGDFQALAQMARQEARKLRAAPGSETAAAKLPPRPQFAHTIPESTPLGQALTLTLRIPDPALASAVRLHYHPLNAPRADTTLVQPPFASTSFSIPATELAPGQDLLVYFEILNQQGSGWFEPDPLAGLPMPVVKVAVAPPSQ